MRHLIAIGVASVLCLAGMAAAQDANPPAPKPGQGPGKMSIPTRSIYRGGFSRPIFRGGFARVMPTRRSVPSTIDPQPSSNRLNQVLDDNDLVTSELQQEGGHSGDSESAGGHSHGEPGGAPCTGQCESDANHHESSEASRPQPENARAQDLISRIRPTEPGPGVFDQAAFDRANKANVHGNGYCMKCHSDKKNFVKKDTPVAVRATDRRLAAELGRRPDTRRLNVQDRAAAAPSMTGSAKPEPVAAEPDPSGSEMVGRAPAVAAESLREHLKDQPGDFHAMRELALALLGSKHAPEAADVMAKAYESDPLLCKEPIDPKRLGLDAARLVNLIKAGAEAARQSNSSKAWLLATVLYQAQGSQSQALAALDKARHAGLNSDVTDWFTAELKKRPVRLAEGQDSK